MPGAMLAPLTTLVFLSVFWLLVVVGAAVLEESGARIAAALRGAPACPISVPQVLPQARSRRRPRRPRPSGPLLRAAA
jgi:hypothetical protein